MGADATMDWITLALVLLLGASLQFAVDDPRIAKELDPGYAIAMPQG